MFKPSIRAYAVHVMHMRCFSKNCNVQLISGGKNKIRQNKRKL